MKAKHSAGTMGTIATSAAIVFALTNLCQAQWIKHPTPGIPRTSDGKPNLAAPAPRTSDGKPDLSGLWQAEPSSIPEIISAIPPDILRQLAAPGNAPSGNASGNAPSGNVGERPGHEQILAQCPCGLQTG